MNPMGQSSHTQHLPLGEGGGRGKGLQGTQLQDLRGGRAYCAGEGDESSEVG